MNGNYEFSLSRITKEQVLNGIIYFSIPRADVLNMNFKNIDNTFKVFRECKHRARGKIILTFSGYEYTADEIFEIPEIREYVTELLNRYSYLFYFLSDIDNNSQIILACLCDIETVYLGEKKQTISEIFYSGGHRDNIGIKYNLNDTLARRITEETIKYGKSVGDKEKQVTKVLKNLFDFSPKKTKYKENPFGSIQEAFFETSKRLWMAFNDEFKDKEMISYLEIESFADRYFHYITNVVIQGYLSVPVLVGRDKPSNIFVVHDKAYGVVCEKCDTSLVLVIKGDFETDVTRLNRMVFLPSAEIFIQNNVTPFDEAFLKQVPVPINPDRDKWYCPFCRTVHDFKYDKDTGLSY
jgi:hypothetical protein